MEDGDNEDWRGGWLGCRAVMRRGGFAGSLKSYRFGIGIVLVSNYSCRFNMR